MDINVILAGVGGQGILSIAYVMDGAALREGYRFKQAEVHGMSQRGGAVQSHLRISKDPIWSDLIPEGALDLVLAVEPLESLRYCHGLKPGGVVVSSENPFLNIPNYPDLETTLDRVAALPRHVLVDADGLAKQAGSPRSSNMVMLGAAAFLMPFAEESLLAVIAEAFQAKGDRVVRANQDAFRFGRDLSAFYRAGLEVGIPTRPLRRLCRVLDPRQVAVGAVSAWKATLEAAPGCLDGLEGRIPGTVAEAEARRG